MKLEPIGNVFKEALAHGNIQAGQASFTTEQIELLTEALKAAFEEYHKQED